MRGTVFLVALFMMIGNNMDVNAGDNNETTDGWRSLPLIQDEKIDPSWVHIGYGGFAIEDGSLKTECVEAGLGLLVYTKEKFGSCQIRIVYKSKDAISNGGMYVRIDDGILDKVNENHAPARRNPDGSLTPDSLKIFMETSEKSLGPWYAVHHGYEVQIKEKEDPMHRTGAIYSLAPATAASPKAPDEWKTMIITLQGNQVLVDIDGQRVTTFDPESKDVPVERQWFEPRRDVKRPVSGYIGLQNHDPGDVVYIKEVSVKGLKEGK